MVRQSGARVGALALAVLLGGGLSACGGGEEDFGDETLEGVVPNGGLNNEDVLADPAVVVEGIATIKGFVNEIITKVGDEQAEFDNEAILPVWEDIEGRIKSEDPATHALLEAQFVALTAAVEKKDKDAARLAGNAIISAFDAYLARPRTTASPTAIPSPSSTATPTVSTTPTGTATQPSTTTPSPSGTASPTF